MLWLDVSHSNYDLSIIYNLFLLKIMEQNVVDDIVGILQNNELHV